MTDVGALTRALETSGRFHRDSRLGRIYHRGAASYRELRPTDSFHVVIDASRVSVHVDRISPLKRRPDGSVRLSLTRILAHNLAGVHGEVTRRLRRPGGSPRPHGRPRGRPRRLPGGAVSEHGERGRRGLPLARHPQGPAASPGEPCTAQQEAP
ncbi:MAG TPA: hypothetical protein VHG90_01795 [Acidimicrobiales bacterium]|nr:hypothetical protein [Acidimicrobiales bacterium]